LTSVDKIRQYHILLDKYLDFGLSYAKRGELLPYVNKLGSFDEHATQFYSAEIVSALEHLHGLGIIHRYVLYRGLGGAWGYPLLRRFF